MITRFPCWNSIEKFVLKKSQRCRNEEWATFLSEISIGELKTLNALAQLCEAFHVTLTTSTEEAINFLCANLELAQPFPLDPLWIGPMNRLGMEINHVIQNWRSKNALRKE
jgi:hypothetical protein